MKKFLIFLAFTLSSLLSCAQAPDNAPTIEQLLVWVDDSYSNFDKDVRSIGYTLEKKDVGKSDESVYTYTQKIERNNVNFIDKIIFKAVRGNKFRSIQYITLQSDLINYFTPKLNARGFQSMDCPASSDEENEIKFCHTDGTHTAILKNKMDTKMVSSLEITETKQ